MCRPIGADSRSPALARLRTCTLATSLLIREDPEMSQTQYELSRAKLDAELEAARKAGDVSRMQMSIAGLMALFKSMYARPPT